MRIWVMENGLVDQMGHHFNNSVGLRTECAQRGLATRFLVHRQAPTEVLRALDARPTFGFRPYEQVSPDPLAGPLESMVVQGNDFAEGLAAAFAEGLGADDLVFVPTAMHSELYGCAVAFGQLPPERRPRLVLNFMVENFLAPGTMTLGLAAPLYRSAARSLARASVPARVLLTANARRMAEGFAEVLAQPVAEFPVLKSYSAAMVSAPDAATGGNPPRVAILGHSRGGKGFLRIPELVARHPRVRFLVQVSPPGSERQWGDAGIAMSAAPNVEMHGTLAREAYDALLRSADVVLLPYDRALMPLRTSGVFCEALAAAKPAVVPSQTWMAEHFAAGSGAGVMFDSFTTDAISGALQLALAQLPELRARATACAPAWRASQNIGAYLDRMQQAFGLSAA